MSDEAEHDKYLEDRARTLGLPTDPEAYQDGGLAVAATAYGVERAEVVASVLRGAGVPAWVEGGATAGWYWHLQFAMHPRGIRILVPNGRLADAQALLAERRQIAQDEKRHEPLERSDEKADPAERLFKWAKRLLVLEFLSMTLMSPLVLPASVWVFAKAWTGFKRTGRDAFKRAMRWSAATGAIALLMLAVLTIVFLLPALQDPTPRLEAESDDVPYKEIVLP